MKLTIVGIFGSSLECFLRPLLDIVGLVLCGVEVESGLERSNSVLELVPTCLIIGL